MKHFLIHRYLQHGDISSRCAKTNFQWGKTAISRYRWDKLMAYFSFLLRVGYLKEDKHTRKIGNCAREVKRISRILKPRDLTEGRNSGVIWKIKSFDLHMRFILRGFIGFRDFAFFWFISIYKFRFEKNISVYKSIATAKSFLWNWNCVM